jgi:Mrp family chromosome partitioning ATPase
MARILDAMKNADNGRLPAAPQAAVVPLAAAEIDNPPDRDSGRIEPAADASSDLHVISPSGEADWPEDEAAVPFIEVGPSRSVEGSPDVLAFRPSARSYAGPQLAAPAADGPRGLSFRAFRGPVAAPAGIAADVVAFHDPTHAINARYRQLLAAVLGATPAAEAPALLFTGSAPGPGTSTVVLNLAVTAASQGRRVVVVDVNPRRPAVAARLALCDRPGVGEVLAGTASVDEALQESGQSGLAALTSGSPTTAVPRAAESYRSLLRQLRQRFDLILLDGPCCDARQFVVAPDAVCDATFLVVPDGDGLPATDELLQQLLARGLHLAGCVVAAR